jgi:hypothetical protein
LLFFTTTSQIILLETTLVFVTCASKTACINGLISQGPNTR